MALKTVKICDDEKRHQLARELNTLNKFLIEGTIADEFPCKYIVGYYDVYCEDMNVYVCLEYMDNGSLQDQLDKNIKLSEPAVAAIAYQSLSGLAFLNEKKIIHRDLKPANILLNKKGEVKLSDFGTAKDEDIGHTFLGTIMFMSPERIQGKEHSFSTDIWSLGIIIYQIATGKYPYDTERKSIFYIIFYRWFLGN